MGYTHYWDREEKISINKMKSIVTDFKKIVPILDKANISLANEHGEGEPEINNKLIRFNGSVNCGHRKDESVVIPWPSSCNSGGVANNWKEDAKDGDWFAGTTLAKRTCNGNCSYETVYFPRVDNPDDCNGSCKTAFRPYDIAVTAFLIIAKYHLTDKIEINTDGEDGNWFDGKMLCQSVLGYGLEYNINTDRVLI
ncbi:MAG: hypothetical protein ACUZ8H_14090 [Candidatus Anammoxibacter sp.]